jgi:hypothetical protein
LDSAKRLCGGAPLDVSDAVALHRNGSPGFYLAYLESDAEYFAARRDGCVLAVDIDDDVVHELMEAGAVRQAIPTAPTSALFDGDELYIGLELFHLFEDHRQRGWIRVSAA